MWLKQILNTESKEIVTVPWLCNAPSYPILLPASCLINQTVVAKTAANMELVLCFARMRTRVSAAHCFVLQTTSQTRLVHFARIREQMFCCSLHNTKGIEDRQGSMTCLELPDSLCVAVWPSLNSIAWKYAWHLSTELLYVLMFSNSLITLNEITQCLLKP